MWNAFWLPQSEAERRSLFKYRFFFVLLAEGIGLKWLALKN
jgi:hypothetical protein